jgi:hypothetical protein
MEKLDRLGWAAGIAFTAFGLRIGVRVSAAELLPTLLSRLPVGWRPVASGSVERLYSIIGGGPGPRASMRRLHLLFGNAQRLARTAELDEALDAFEADVSLYCATAARRRLFVHAGVVGWKQKAILMPGRSFSGKSTLVRAFLQAGATYYSDEFAVLDKRGHVHPFPRPLSLRVDFSGKQTKISPEALGARTGTDPLPVSMVLLSQFRSNVQWRPRVLTSGQGALGLLANTPAARMRPQRALEILISSLAQAKIFTGTRGEAAETVQHVLGQLEN